jgi:hypothetical protein
MVTIAPASQNIKVEREGSVSRGTDFGNPMIQIRDRQFYKKSGNGCSWTVANTRARVLQQRYL